MVLCSCSTLTHLICVKLPYSFAFFFSCQLHRFAVASTAVVLMVPLFISCELHHTFSFSWVTHCMTPSDMLYLISSPRSSSFNLSSAVWEPLFPFPFVSSPRPFYRGCSYHCVSPFSSFAQTFDPLDPANYHLLSTAWFPLKWIIFLASQEDVNVKALKFIHYEPEHIFHTHWSFFCNTNPPWDLCWWMFSAFQDGRMTLGLKDSAGLSSVDLHGSPVVNFFQPGVLHTALNQPWIQLLWVPGLLDPQLALFLPISYYRHYRYCVVFQQLSAATFTAAIKRISLRQLCTRSESNSFFTPWDKTKALLLENWVKIIS